ncbi:MAG: DUF4159 domain-containing protein [Candidatus Eisenbacteria bacterium]|uniref:DUF4159 domain-containing protein n=1 Tax=Eiseniibacteriota bacterium TaxID=2212470 RepID=A0A7Y2H4C8_UNCEI|nr:DUF4159 domain-containing protein [Candidatus Eisenbacteria bacterium]
MKYQHLYKGLLFFSLVFFAAVQAVPAEASKEDFQIARLKYGGGGDWYSNPSSLPNLMEGIKERTPIVAASLAEVRVELLDESLFSYPMLYMNGHGEVRLSQAEVDRLREYLERGGFLWADDNYGMDRSFRRELAKVFPETELVPLPFKHRLFNCYYDLPKGTPKIHEHDNKPPQSLGLYHKGRLVVVYTYEADIGDGLEDTAVHKDPEAVREAAMQYAINLVTYVMTH